MRGALLVALLCLFAVAPLTYPGFFEAQSGFTPAYNVQHPLTPPNWGPSWLSLRGEGAVPYLLAWPFLWLSGSGVIAIKWGYALAFLVGALAAYFWSRRWLGVEGSVLAAAVYTYLPWHLSAVYVRGAYAEAWLWALLPLVFYILDSRTGRTKSLDGLLGLVVSVALLFTNAGFGIVLAALAAAYGLLIHGLPRHLVKHLAAVALLLMALAIVGNLLADSPRSSVEGFLYPYQLLTAAWDLGPAAPGNPIGGLGEAAAQGTSYQLGMAAVGLSLVAVALWAGRRSFEGPAARTAEAGTPEAPLLGRALACWLALLLVGMFLTLRPSAFLWRLARLDSFVAHPWQLLVLTGLPLAFLAGSVTRLDRRLAGLPVWAGLVALSVLASYPYLAPRFTRVQPGTAPVALFRTKGTALPQITLVAVEVAPVAEITTTLALTLTWQASEPLPQDYTVFVHLLAGDQKIAQGDDLPCNGECRTFSWQPGQILVDRHEIQLPPHAPAGPYRVAIGLYRADTGERAAVVGRDDGMVVVNVP